MGYYTDYKIVLGNVDQEENKEQIKKDLEKYCSDLVSLLKCEFRENHEYDDIITERGEIIGGRWYKHEEEMTEFSKHYPNLNITLTGSGEEIEDYWVMYIKDGKAEKFKAEFPKATLW